MELGLTQQEQAFREEVRTWVRANLPAATAEKTRLGLKLSRADLQGWAKILGTRGWVAAVWPREFGGPGWNPIEKYLFEEECYMADAPRVVPFGPSMVAPVLMSFGSAGQQQRFLPGIASGDVWWCQGFSEPGSGSDLASLQTRAELRGDRYVVTGQKTWTTQGHLADWMCCLVRTGSDGKPQTGISFLLIDMKSPGVTVRPIITIGGEHMVNEVWLDGVEVPAGNLVGEENRGWTYAKLLLAYERHVNADVNHAKRQLERLKEIAGSERSGGRALIDEPRFRDEIARLEIDILALEMMVLRVVTAERTLSRAMDLASLLKIRGTEVQQRYTELMMRAAGVRALPYLPEAMEAGWQGDYIGQAYTAPLASQYFYYRHNTIASGSNEVQRNIVAQQIFAA